jgi:uncharacterized protein YdcH (DUF465 family)
MPLNRDEVYTQLLNSDEEFKRLVERHRQLDDEAKRLDAKSFLIPDESHRVRGIKREKLILKDHIERRIREILESQS